MVRTVCCTANMPRRQLYGKSVSSVCKASPALAKEGGSHFWGCPPCVEKQERFLILSTHEYERNLPHAGLAQMIVQSRLGEFAKMSNYLLGILTSMARIFISSTWAFVTGIILLLYFFSASWNHIGAWCVSLNEYLKRTRCKCVKTSAKLWVAPQSTTRSGSVLKRAK